MPSCMDNSIRILKGVGERRAAQFEQGGVSTVGELLRRYPRSYEDWSHPLSIAEAPFGEPCCIRAAVLTVPAEHRIRRGMVLYKFEAGDARARMTVTLFNNPYAAARLRAGDVCLFYGTVGGGFTRREMASPKIEPDGGTARLHPVYRQTAGLTSRVIESTVARALERMEKESPPDPLPETLRREWGLCPLPDALRGIHAPPDSRALEQARRRLVFEELLVLQLGLLRMKSRGKAAAGMRTACDHTAEFAALLPFSLTGAQRRAISDCLRDMSSGTAMSRLIQGDVGSGKTAVAAGVAYTIIREGWQAAMMAPTEILAEQHFRSFSSLLEGASPTEGRSLRIGLLTGSLPAARRRETLAALAAGEIDLLVGTHALLSDGVEFARLGLVITDEQHRFGVEQRALLAAKGNHPHLMVMSATPIPRTLALILYGDLDVSVLDELPPGRTPVATYAVDSRKRERAYGYVRRHLDQGRQGYLVCPLVEEREDEEGGPAAAPLASAVEVEKRLADGPFRDYRLGLLHSRMKPAEKERVMTAFSAGEIDLLVATTVIEVGVDVPNAVIMVIENAERFGLAQLHQLRGRVGRGQHASSCILISDAQNEEAVRRLRVMCETSDGFRIADEDLKLRGPGDFFGRRQHGLPSTRLADLSGAGDLRLFQQAQLAAHDILREDPALEQPAHIALAEEVRLLFHQVGEQGLN
ncbi:MAG: ATP-dependent DNA helicase RecG [Clostridiales bacterium]|nr:ATP-dependent DNA helicase RecG [Clostridiales bacterium]